MMDSQGIDRCVVLYKQAADFAHKTIDKEFWGCDAFEGVILGKFAELIIQECIQMADDFEWDINRSGLVSRMKEHFGVE